MKIVILDGYTATRGDYDYDFLKNTAKLFAIQGLLTS